VQRNARKLRFEELQFTKVILAVVAALREKMFWVGLLKISAPDFITWNLRRNGENRNAAAMAVVEPIDQMEVTGTAAAGADPSRSKFAHLLEKPKIPDVVIVLAHFFPPI
jgi:hypothetical protein